MLLLTGMNKFLRSLEITFRRDSSNLRPRINKRDSVKVSEGCRIANSWWGVRMIVHSLHTQDVEQKRSGNFFFLDT